MEYIFTLGGLIIFYVICLFAMQFFKNYKVTNSIFVISIFLLYIAELLYVYFTVGSKDWNFMNILPIANMSPFMFALTPLYFILPKKIKPYYLSIVSLLSIGMALSPIISCIYYIRVEYSFFPQFLLGYLAHLLLSLWGVYVVKTKQCHTDFSKTAKSASIVFWIVAIMMIINFIFDTSFFGLSLKGKHNIYGMVLVSSSYVSAIIYIAGLCAVMILSYIYNKLLCKFLYNEKNK